MCQVMIPSRVRHSCIIRVEAVFIEGMSACVVSARMSVMNYGAARALTTAGLHVVWCLLRVRQVCANPLV